MAPVIGIIGALEKEVRCIYEQIENGSVTEEAGLKVMTGEYDGLKLTVCTAGMGTVNAAAATQHLISAHGATCIIFSGIAGGLNPKLHISDVVAGETLRYLDTDTALIAESAPGLEEYASTPALVNIAEEALAEAGYLALDAEGLDGADVKHYLRGTIATGDTFCTGTAMREAAIAATQADCVEMEGAAIAHIAAKNGADCLVLRAISDNCDEAYDAFCEREFDLDQYALSASSLTLNIVRRIAAAA